MVLTPCDYPQTLAAWTLKRGGGDVRLKHKEGAGTNTGDVALCLGAADPPTNPVGDPAVTLVACDAASVLMYNVTTGRISPTGNGTDCVTAVQRGPHDTGAPAMKLSPCGAIPSETQQFQYNPNTGALRPKTSAVSYTHLTLPTTPYV